MVDLVLYQLPTLSLGFIIGLLVKILISSVILYLSVKLVGGYADFSRSILLSVIMDSLNLIVFPFFKIYFGSVFGGILAVILGPVLWFILIKKFFGLSLFRAILLALVQTIVTSILMVLGFVALIGTILGIFSV